MTTASRYHDISTGHRVHGHENKCKHLHGHNYRVHFHVEGGTLDNIGRVLDFGVIKSALCLWLEDNWDHRFLVFKMIRTSPRCKPLTRRALLPYRSTQQPKTWRNTWCK